MIAILFKLKDINIENIDFKILKDYGLNVFFVSDRFPKLDKVKYIFFITDNLEDYKDIEFLVNLGIEFLYKYIVLPDNLNIQILTNFLNYINSLNENKKANLELVYELGNVKTLNIWSSIERFFSFVLDKILVSMNVFDEKEISGFVESLKNILIFKDINFLFFDYFNEVIKSFPPKHPKTVKDIFKKQLLLYRVNKSVEDIIKEVNEFKELFIFVPYDNGYVVTLGMLYFSIHHIFYERVFVNLIDKIKKIVDFLNKRMINFCTLQRSIKELKTLNSISTYWSSLSSVDDIIDMVIKKATNLFKADVVTLMFLDGEYLYIKKSYGLPKEVLNIRQRIGEGIAGKVAETGKPIIINDMDLEKDKIDLEKNYKSSIVVPLKAQDKVIGVMSVSKISYYPFNSNDLETLQNLAMICANSVEKIRLYQDLQKYSQKLEETYVSTIKSLAKAFEARDKYNKGHMERVLKYGLAIAFELDPKLVQDDVLKLSLLFHDIGKIEIPDNILNKPFKLTNEEYEIIKRHPEAGEEILRNVKFLSDVAEIVKQHQERWDGKGYPRGLKGEEIHLYARIVALADAFDAMTSDRVYRKAMSIEEAIDEIIRNKGTQFDPLVVDAFLRAYQNGLIKVEDEEEFVSLDQIVNFEKIRGVDGD